MTEEPVRTGGRELSEGRKGPLMIHCSVGTRSCLCPTNRRKLVLALGFDDMTHLMVLCHGFVVCFGRLRYRFASWCMVQCTLISLLPF